MSDRFTAVAVLLLAASLSACASVAPVPQTAVPRASEVPDFFADLPRAQLAILGTFHFQDAGLDSYRPEHHIDVRAPERQAEVEELMRLLVAFQPTRIAIEQPRFRQPRLDSLYNEYRAGRWQLGANEIYQLGFRLAGLLGHARVHAVDAEDHPGQMAFWRENRATLDAAESAEVELNRRYRMLYRHADSLKMHRTLREHYLYLNDPARIRMTHGHYMIGSFKAETDANEYVGPDAALGWYSRNLRIFRNLQRITESPRDRVLLIIGSGHLPTLRFFADASPEFELIDIRDVLAPVAR